MAINVEGWSGAGFLEMSSRDQNRYGYIDPIDPEDGGGYRLVRYRPDGSMIPTEFARASDYLTAVHLLLDYVNSEIGG